MLQRFGFRRLTAMVPRRALAGLAILLAAALTLGGPVSPAPGPTYEATLASNGSTEGNIAAVRALDTLWLPQTLSAADDEALAPPPEGAEADSGHLSEARSAWPGPLAVSRASIGTIEPSRSQFRAFRSRGPPLGA